MTRARLLRLVSCVVAALASVAFAQGPDPLTNEDVTKMVRAGLATTVVLAAIDSAKVTAFDVSPTALIALHESGVPDEVIRVMQFRTRAQEETSARGAAAPADRERSVRLETAKDPAFVLRNFKSMQVDASRAQFFGSDLLKTALEREKGFDQLKIIVVDNSSVADVVLEVGYTFAWEYPFSLKHQNTSMVLLSGKGSGPFSGPRGATSVAREFVKLLKPYRAAPAPEVKKQ